MNAPKYVQTHKSSARITWHLHYQYCNIRLTVASQCTIANHCPQLPTVACGVTKMRKAGNHWPDFSHAVMASNTGKESNAVNELSCSCVGHLHPSAFYILGPLAAP